MHPVCFHYSFAGNHPIKTNKQTHKHKQKRGKTILVKHLCKYCSLTLYSRCGLILLVFFQFANDRWASSFLSWLFCQRSRPPRARYMHLDQELKEDAGWPPQPASVTYAVDSQSYTNAL